MGAVPDETRIVATFPRGAQRDSRDNRSLSRRNRAVISALGCEWDLRSHANPSCRRRDRAAHSCGSAAYPTLRDPNAIGELAWRAQDETCAAHALHGPRPLCAVGGRYEKREPMIAEITDRHRSRRRCRSARAADRSGRPGYQATCRPLTVRQCSPGELARRTRG